jgi:hypothetical protein
VEDSKKTFVKSITQYRVRMLPSDTLLLIADLVLISIFAIIAIIVVIITKRDNNNARRNQALYTEQNDDEIEDEQLLVQERGDSRELVEVNALREENDMNEILVDESVSHVVSVSPIEVIVDRRQSVPITTVSVSPRVVSVSPRTTSSIRKEEIDMFSLEVNIPSIITPTPASSIKVVHQQPQIQPQIISNTIITPVPVITPISPLSPLSPPQQQQQQSTQQTNEPEENIFIQSSIRRVYRMKYLSFVMTKIALLNVVLKIIQPMTVTSLMSSVVIRLQAYLRNRIVREAQAVQLPFRSVIRIQSVMRGLAKYDQVRDIIDLQSALRKRPISSQLLDVSHIQSISKVISIDSTAIIKLQAALAGLKRNDGKISHIQNTIMHSNIQNNYQQLKNGAKEITSVCASKMLQNNEELYELVQILQSISRNSFIPKIITEDLSAQATEEHLIIQSIIRAHSVRMQRMYSSVLLLQSKFTTVPNQKLMKNFVTNLQSIQSKSASIILEPDVTAQKQQAIDLQSIFRVSECYYSLNSFVDELVSISSCINTTNSSHLEDDLQIAQRIQAICRTESITVTDIELIQSYVSYSLESRYLSSCSDTVVSIQTFISTVLEDSKLQKSQMHLQVIEAVGSTYVCSHSSAENVLLLVQLQAVLNTSVVCKTATVQLDTIPALQAMMRQVLGKDQVDSISDSSDSILYACRTALVSEMFNEDQKLLSSIQGTMLRYSVPGYELSIAYTENIQTDITTAIAVQNYFELENTIPNTQAVFRIREDVGGIVQTMNLLAAHVRMQQGVSSILNLLEQSIVSQSVFRQLRDQVLHGFDTKHLVNIQQFVTDRNLAIELLESKINCISIQSETRSTNIIDDYWSSVNSCTVMQSVIRYSQERTKHLLFLSEVETSLVALQSAINGKIHSDNSLALVQRKEEGEEELISTHAVLDNIFYPRVDKLRLHAATGITDSIEFGTDVAKKMIEKCLINKEHTLDLSGVNLRILPKEMMQCKHVRMLNLSNNDISILPSWFGDVFQFVESLDLSHNKLFELPQSFEEMDRLKSLDLSYNKFEYFPQIIAYMNIEVLNISHNYMLIIQSDFMMDNLINLDVSYNYLLRLPETISDLKKLKSLNIQNNRFLQSEIGNVTKIYTPFMSPDEDVKAFILSMRTANELGYTTTDIDQRENPLNADEDDNDVQSDTSEMTELIESDIEYDSDYDSESETDEPSMSRSRSAINLKLDLKGVTTVDRADELDSDRSSTSTSSEQYNTPTSDRFSLLDMGDDMFASSYSLKRSNSTTLSPATPRTRSSSAAIHKELKFTQRLFGYDRKPEQSPIYSMLVNEDIRRQFHQFCDNERIICNELNCWQAIWTFKFEQDEQEKKDQAAYIYFTYIDSKAPQRINLPNSLVEVISIQLADELEHARALSIQLSLDPLPIYFFDSVLCYAQEGMMDVWTRFKQSSDDLLLDEPQTNASVPETFGSPFSPKTPIRSPMMKSTPSSAAIQHIVMETVDEATILSLENLALKKIDFRERIAILFEILESERKYVKFLQVLWDLYYSAIVNNHNTGERTGFFRKRLVSEASAKKMLPPTLRTMIAFNLQLLRKLEARFSIYEGQDPISINFMRIADLFIKITPLLDVYVSYISMYEASIMEIKRYKQKHTFFDVWLTKRKKKRESSGLDLPSLLVMPVQRLIRYKMLLQNLLRHTPRDHIDYEALVKATEMFSEFTVLQAEKIKETNRRIKIQQIGKMLKIDDLDQPNRVLIREGKCTMNNLPQKAYLLSDILVLREKKRFMDKLLPTVRTFSLAGAIVSSGEHNTSIIIELKALHTDEIEHRTIVLKFSSVDIQRIWMQDITTAIEKLDQDNNQIKQVQSHTITNRLRRSVSLSRMSRRFSFSENQPPTIPNNQTK